MIDTTAIEILAPALFTGFMICLTHAPLGIEVLKRGIIFIDIAVAQTAGLGLIVASLLLEHPHWVFIQFFALSFSFLSSLFFYWIEKKIPQQQEAIIGSYFITIASLSLLLLANHPHGNEKIHNLLSGNILFTTWKDIGTHFPIYVAILYFWFKSPFAKKGLTFYVLLSFAITSSVQLVGVYLVFASLILPALASLKFHRKNWVACSSGFVAVFVGIFISYFFDLIASPVMILCFVFNAILINLIKKLK